MRLEKIKIAGFKSFVDPTSILIPSNLVGIVGPNGCGKSNTIDAVRWVMGESSAKMLRGESMADVIFNGSTSRKPVGMATVELIFDNSEGRAGGQYAAFNQISVKRRIQRDGQSQFYLNGSRCRRRDITDLFMGTGLGPRSYSIIEQGMISRLIEARPEDLRAFLEEAAGISKYKDRRKETERRIKHTRENLERLADLIEEVDKQLHHLKRQADVAEKFRRLKGEERRLNAELIALTLRDQQADFGIHDEQIDQYETALQQAIADQRRLEKQQILARENHSQFQIEFNQIQGEFYQVGSDIAQLEQAIKFAHQNLTQLKKDLEKNTLNWHQAQTHQQQDALRLQTVQMNIDEEEPRLLAMKAQESEAILQLQKVEQQLSVWQQQWDSFNDISREPIQVTQVERAKINHLEQQGERLLQRQQKMQVELQQLGENSQVDEQAILQEQSEEYRQQLIMQSEQLNELVEDIEKIRQDSQQVSHGLNQVTSQFQTCTGRLASLEALQQAALGRQNSKSNEWLSEHGLGEASRLAEQMQVNHTWQHAVETVLGHHLQAVCVSDLSTLNMAFDVEHKVMLIQSQQSIESNLPRDALLHQVSSPNGLYGLLSGVRCVDDIFRALGQRHKLMAHESFITTKGEWVGVNWIKLGQLSQEASGVLERGQWMVELVTELDKIDVNMQALQAQVDDGQHLLKQAEQHRHALQQGYNETQRQLSGLESRLSAMSARVEQNHSREIQLQDELEELKQQHQEGIDVITESRIILADALAQIDQYKLQRENFLAKRDRLSLLLKQAQEDTQRLHSQVHEVALRLQTFTTLIGSLKPSLERMQIQLELHVERKMELQQQLEDMVAPLEEQKIHLADVLQHRIEIEDQLKEARETLQTSEALLRDLDQQRHQVEQTVQIRREAAEKVKVLRQESLFNLKNLEQQLLATGFTQTELLTDLVQNGTPDVWQESLLIMSARIKRLGAINLAAIDEHKEQEQRMLYLTSQKKDITESLEMLENAMRKIDCETRTKFKETYDQVNAGLKERFPKLFGGGHAYLQLTGDDLLDTGVTVMACPPGKRNTSIHLLSGGEKALTAVALVFSIFDLNPAPFCMLDEVDAPLDDANVGRFCELVKSMSDKVQFIFITHNKITMEISHQLMGVTMHEPGVSRLVSVDMEQAADMVMI